MICDSCKSEGKRSRIEILSSSSTLIAGPSPHYDEDGRFHVHDPNTTTTSFMCSNGHEWTKTAGVYCPVDSCSWNKDVPS